jgi:hypothetical protein
LARSFSGTELPANYLSQPPPAIDPRMDREPAEEDGTWTVVLIPSDAVGSVREYSLTARQLRRWRRALVVAGTMVAALVIALGITLPRSLAYQGVVTENLSLKLHLQEIDRRMVDVDRILLRLRLYDAQLKSLAEPTGDHGPVDRAVPDLPPIPFTNRPRAEEVLEPTEGTDTSAAELRSVESWATSHRTSIS